MIYMQHCKFYVYIKMIPDVSIYFIPRIRVYLLNSLQQKPLSSQ